MDICSSCIRAQGMEIRDHISMPSVTTRVRPLQLFVVLVASYFVDLLINHGNPLVIVVSLIRLSCSL